jgi:hypothetical protein
VCVGSCVKKLPREREKTTAPVVAFFEFCFKCTKYPHLVVCFKWREYLENILNCRTYFCVGSCIKKLPRERGKNHRALGAFFEFCFKCTKFPHLVFCSKRREYLENILNCRTSFFYRKLRQKIAAREGKKRCARGGIFLSFFKCTKYPHLTV